MSSELEKYTPSIILDNLVIHYVLSIRQMGIYTVSLPLVALLICFVTASIFQADDVHETHCRVYNVLPSISAITGVSPQRYLWRMTVAVHLGPRFIISLVNRAYHINTIRQHIKSKNYGVALFWTNMTFWLDFIEICSFCGVTYVSNLENYFIHEKFFIIFMVSSLTHMIACIQAARWVSIVCETPPNRRSLLAKESLLAISLLSTVGVIIFFAKHRLLCHDMAFTWFACFEYILAFANMAFHMSIIMDFPTEHLVVAKGIHYETSNQNESAKKTK